MKSTQDATEVLRRHRLLEINSAVDSDDVLTERQRLEARYGQTWDAAQLAEDFEVLVFDGHEFVVGYASYLIEYLNGVLHEQNTNAQTPA